MSYRLWWLMACFALVLGLAIEREQPAAGQPETASQPELFMPGQAAFASPEALHEPADGG